MWKKDIIYFFSPKGPQLDSNTIIVDDEITLLVDPGTSSRSYLKRILGETGNSLEEVDIVLNTHGHYDHFQGNTYFPEAEKIAFYPDSEDISEETSEDIRAIKKESVLSTGKLDFRILHTPGHSMGSCCLYLPGEVLVCGDLVLAEGSFGRVDLKGGSFDELKRSIKRLCDLDFEHLLPGHGGVGNKNSVRRALSFVERSGFQ